MQPDRVVVPLGCGHGWRVPERGQPPRKGFWITCQVAGCRRIQRVTAADGPAVYVQDALL